VTTRPERLVVEIGDADIGLQIVELAHDLERRRRLDREGDAGMPLLEGRSQARHER
jgi:hypothetical protein